jgi:hypothetical protein
MATKKTKQENNKVTFGKKKKGKLKKSYGPKEEKPKRYLGQGR